MRAILDKFGKLTQKLPENLNNEPSGMYCMKQAPSSPITSTKAVQTDFPVEMLESYVVKNKKRILALLNIPHDSVSSVCSVPCKVKKNDQFDHQKSWNTLPKNESCISATSHSPRPKVKDVGMALLNGNSAKTHRYSKEDLEPDYNTFHVGKRCSEGDITRQTCLVPLLSNGASCSLVNERKIAITDF